MNYKVQKYNPKIKCTLVVSLLPAVSIILCIFVYDELSIRYSISLIISNYVDNSLILCVISLFIFETGPTNLFRSISDLDDVELLASWIVKANALLTNLITSFVLSAAMIKLILSASLTLTSISNYPVPTSL